MAYNNTRYIYIVQLTVVPKDGLLQSNSYMFLICFRFAVTWLSAIVRLELRLGRHLQAHAAAVRLCCLWDFWKCFCDRSVTWRIRADDHR